MTRRPTLEVLPMLDEAFETKVYRNYRAALKSIRSSNSARPYAAGCRQFARRVTVERYGVTYAEVKRIVADHDAAAGITHAPGGDHLARLVVEQARKDFDACPTPCPECGGLLFVRVRAPRVNPTGAFTILCLPCDIRLRGQ